MHMIYKINIFNFSWKQLFGLFIFIIRLQFIIVITLRLFDRYIFNMLV